MHWPKLVNILMTVAVAGTAIFSLSAWWPSPLPSQQVASIPLRDFASESTCYERVGTGCFALNRVTPQPQLPQLEGELVFLGANGRPDARDAELYLTTKNGSDPVRVSVDEPQYLAFAGEGFQFASTPTHLWLTPQKADGEKLTLAIGMETPNGSEEAMLTLPAQEGRKGAVWQMGQLRVDTSLLARQRARWFGEDRFLAEHGGDDFAQSIGREKLEFGEGGEAYSAFVGIGEGLIWKGERWCPSPLGETSRPHPLLVLTKKEERALHFELWDEAGRMRTPITVMRSRDGWLPSHLKEALHFVAAKTWSQFVLEWGQERMHVRPGDWLLLDKEGWKILATSEEVLDYAAGRLTGELLVIEGLSRSEGKHLLQGHLFNTTRSDRAPFEIPLTLELRPGASHLVFAKKEEVAHMAPPQLEEDPGKPITVQIPIVRGPAKGENR